MHKHMRKPKTTICTQIYTQNLNTSQGMLDAQLDRLITVLQQGRIWALNVGENFAITRKVGCVCVICVIWSVYSECRIWVHVVCICIFESTV